MAKKNDCSALYEASRKRLTAKLDLMFEELWSDLANTTRNLEQLKNDVKIFLAKKEKEKLSDDNK